MSAERIRFVITGASGFIGMNVVKLLQRMHNVDTIPVTRQCIAGWCQVPDYREAPEGDILIHLGENSVRGQVEMLDEVYEREVQSTLSALMKNQYSVFMYTSSSTIYGLKHDSPRKTTDATEINDKYSRIKRQSEKIILEDANGAVARLANVYGLGMSRHTVIHKIISQIPGTGPLVVADTSPIRDFIQVKDVAAGLISVALCLYRKKTTEKIYNLGTGVGTAIGTLAQSALECAGESSRTVLSEFRPKSSSTLILDPSKTTNICGWKPQISLREGITNLLAERH